MSKVEHDSWRDSACLCGNGRVTRHVESTDYPFGGASTTYSLEYSTCSRTWRLDGRTFVDRASEAAASVAYEAFSAVNEMLSALASAIVDRHIASAELRTRKAELAELERLGLSGGDYRSYTKARSNGSTPGRATNLYAGLGDLLSIAGADASMLTTLSERSASLRAEWIEAGERVVRRRPL